MPRRLAWRRGMLTRKTAGEAPPTLAQVRATCRMPHIRIVRQWGGPPAGPAYLPSRSAERGIADKPCQRIHLDRSRTACLPVLTLSVCRIQYVFRFLRFVNFVSRNDKKPTDEFAIFLISLGRADAEVTLDAMRIIATKRAGSCVAVGCENAASFSDHQAQPTSYGQARCAQLAKQSNPQLLREKKAFRDHHCGGGAQGAVAGANVTGAVAQGLQTGCGAGQTATGVAAGRRSQLQQQHPALLRLRARIARISDVLFMIVSPYYEEQSVESLTMSAQDRFAAGKAGAHVAKFALNHSSRPRKSK